MHKSIEIYLNKFPQTPHSLRKNPQNNAPVETTQIDLARLYHHHYIDKIGKMPPSPDPSRFEPVHLLTPDDDFRFLGEGYGIHPGAKIAGSMELGHAFCRWFLHDHCGITYFKHLHYFLNKPLHHGFGRLRVLRTSDGDAPDYMCAKTTKRVCIAEAKGRYTSINFTNKEFQKWREQFNRIAVVDENDVPLATKGYIVGTRFATQATPNVMSSLHAEDPKTPGEIELSAEDSEDIAADVIRYHYASILEKMNLPVVAFALQTGGNLSPQLGMNVFVWELSVERFGVDIPKRYVGGFWHKGYGAPAYEIIEGELKYNPNNGLMLNASQDTFFGLEEGIFRQIIKVVRDGNDYISELNEFPDPGGFYSAISTLRDGSLMAPIGFLRPVAEIPV